MLACAYSDKCCALCMWCYDIHACQTACSCGLSDCRMLKVLKVLVGDSQSRFFWRIAARLLCRLSIWCIFLVLGLSLLFLGFVFGRVVWTLLYCAAAFPSLCVAWYCAGAFPSLCVAWSKRLVLSQLSGFNTRFVCFWGARRELNHISALHIATVLLNSSYLCTRSRHLVQEVSPLVWRMVLSGVMPACNCATYTAQQSGPDRCCVAA